MESATIDTGTLAAAPAGPVPQAPPGRPAGPAPTIGIPDGDPAAAAMALLRTARPDADAVLRGRIAALGTQCADLVEAARLDPRGTLGDFLHQTFP
jgi:hypothetical protein